MENMERFTPSYIIAYAITNSMENLRFDKEDYFHVLVFYGLFYKRNRKHFSPCSHTVYKHSRGSLGELEITWKHSPCVLVFPLQFLVLPNFHSCSYNRMETRKMFFYSLNIASHRIVTVLYIIFAGPHWKNTSVKWVSRINYYYYYYY